MRGVAYAIGERELLMRLHEQGISLSALSRQTGIRRELLSRWWKRFREQGRAGLEPRSRPARGGRSIRQVSCRKKSSNGFCNCVNVAGGRRGSP